VVFYCLVIFLQSAFPPAVRDPLFPFADKGAHLFIYAVLGILFYRAFKTPSVKSATAAVWTVLSSTLYGVSDEIHQAFVPLRSAEVGDILADALGSALGVLLFMIVFPAFRNAPDRPSVPS
jgi:VanZ family protein